MKRFIIGLATSWAATSALPAGVLITEIFYNPPAGGDYEYVEVHNSGASAADVSGWSLTSGITYLFPERTIIPPGAYVVIASSREAFRRVYPQVAENLVLGDFAGSLANEGERLKLSDLNGNVHDSVTYDDDSPWDFLADGFGASLERACYTADSNAPENWRASVVPSQPEEFGGSPGAASRPEACPPPPTVRPRVMISEIMYHPVLEQSVEDEREFIEIHNAGAEPVSLAGWRISGGIDYAFPAGTSLAPGAYAVIAKNRAKLAQVAEYGLKEGDLFGDYERTLDNGGDKVALIAADGTGIESVSYDDDKPWPVAADALGAGEEWLPRDILPLTNHRYRGHSLERVSFGTPAGELANWAPSPLDGPTPGKPNASARERPLPAVGDIVVQSAARGNRLIRAGEEVLVQVAFTPEAPAGAVEIEFFIDDAIRGVAEPSSRLTLHDDGANGGDLIPRDKVYSATLPGNVDSTIVRYKIRADRGAGLEEVAPRPTDPNDWLAYFVSPVIDTKTQVLQVFITPANWGRMWSNIAGNRVQGCNDHPTWNSRVPAVLVHEGEVYDVFVRYQGSRWNRTNGLTITRWTYPRPAVGSLIALSWRLYLPRYSQLDKKTDITLNKLTQGCPGYNAGVGYRLFEQAGVPGSNVRFTRFHVNGGYYHYMLQLERPDEEMMRRWHNELEEKDPTLPKARVGHLFKSIGCNCDEGPYSWGDERLINASCGHPKEVRYAHTYNRKTHGWDSHAEFIQLIEDLHAAKREGNEAVRAYFAERFDLDLLLSYMAIINWSVPFDDMFQNHFLYQRLSDGKWLLFPWDLDQNFGEWKGANSSIYMGEIGNVDNRSGWSNLVKDAFLKSYRQEFDDRLFLLNNTVLHPDNVGLLVDEVTAQLNMAEAAQSPAGTGCSFQARAGSFKSFAATRFSVVNSQVAKVKLSAGADQTVFVGSTVTLDASASTPDPPDAEYTWDNGMTGEIINVVFNTPGEHTITLVLKVRGVEFTDPVKITVLPLPDRAFKEAGGQVVMEAENLFANERHNSPNTWWEQDSVRQGFTGLAYMEAKQSRRQTFPQRYVGLAPELIYAIQFTNPGTYRVWIRAFSPDSFADSVYVGLNGMERPIANAHQFVIDPEFYKWSGDTRSRVPQTLTVTAPGLVPFSVWVRDSGQIIDKIILTQDQAFVPDDSGPPESARGAIGGPESFVRGDADGNSRLNVLDPLRILRHLFASQPLSCEDHGDVDDSGAVNVTDAIVLLTYLFQRGPPPAAPFPAAGFDATADAFGCGSE